jgi:hypothetical protein
MSQEFDRPKTVKSPEFAAWAKAIRAHPCPRCQGRRKPCDLCKGSRIDPKFGRLKDR